MNNNIIYDHYIAIDWAQTNMAVARITKKSNKITAFDVPSDIVNLQDYLKNLKGTKVLIVEETTTSQWLYTELREFVDRIIVCDPHRNRLLTDGPKNDKIDATKLVQLLKAGLVKEVYHSADKFLYLRRLVSGYEDLVQSGVRSKNQRYSLLRACGKTGYEEKGFKLESAAEQFVLEGLDRQISAYESEKKAYEKEFKRLAKKYKEIKYQTSLPGIDIIHGIKIVTRVVTPFRFETKGKYLSYAGLIKHEKISGGKSYGKKTPRYSRQLKSVYKTAVTISIGKNNPINDYYEYLIKKKEYSEKTARSAACRRLAILSLGVFKSSKRYEPKRRYEFKERISK